MANPKRGPRSPNNDIDKMIGIMRRKFPELPPDEQINLIKTAIMWEKVKHGIKDDEEGKFFQDDEAQGNNDD